MSAENDRDKIFIVQKMNSEQWPGKQPKNGFENLEFILSVKGASCSLYKEWGLQRILLSLNIWEEEAFAKTFLVNPPGQNYNHPLWADQMRKLSLMLRFHCDSAWNLDGLF